MVAGNNRNADLPSLLGVDMVGRMEANYIAGQILSTYRTIPGLRGLWPLSSIGDGGNAIDMSGQGRTLTYTGTPTYNRYVPSGESYVSYVDFNGTTDYFTRADETGLDILGTEAFVGTSKGLSMGTWFWADDTGVGRNLMGKWGAAGQRSYFLQRGATNACIFGVSNNGTASTTVTSTNTTTSGKWYFVSCSYTPSTSMVIYLTDYSLQGYPITATSNVTSIPAAIFNSTAGFTLAVLASLAGYHDGRLAYSWLSTMALPANWHNLLYEQSRGLFNV